MRKIAYDPLESAQLHLPSLRSRQMAAAKRARDRFGGACDSVSSGVEAALRQREGQHSVADRPYGGAGGVEGNRKASAGGLHGELVPAVSGDEAFRLARSKSRSGGEEELHPGAAGRRPARRPGPRTAVQG